MLPRFHGISFPKRFGSGHPSAYLDPLYLRREGRTVSAVAGTKNGGGRALFQEGIAEHDVGGDRKCLDCSGTGEGLKSLGGGVDFPTRLQEDDGNGYLVPSSANDRAGGYP